MFKSIYEPAEAEVARLAAAPEGSINHSLSKLPVNIEGWLEDVMIELPRIDNWQKDRVVVVVPYQRFKEPSTETRTMPYQRHRGSWACIVVASNDRRYPVGGNRLAISEAELVRGTRRTFELPDVTLSSAQSPLEAGVIALTGMDSRELAVLGGFAS